MSRVRIVHNRLLGGWFIVRGSHDTPISGRFDSREQAKAHLDAKSAPKRRIHRNVWGNTKGYLGTRLAHDFGLDEQAANVWVNGGELPKFDASIFKHSIKTQKGN